MVKLDAQRDPRLIPLGAFLRSSGLDELPQLLNVLRGEMSLVGPRPCIPYEYELYDAWQRRRFEAVPGLTGLWQVSGKNQTTFPEMIALDIRYAETCSLWLDLEIILRTPVALWQQLQQNRAARKQETLLAGQTLAQTNQ
jgi:lipopolysaccharide/colanic/teichoic acid biosynthesis glycosyltransferase